MTNQKPTIYLAIKYHPDHSNRTLIEKITVACTISGFDTVCIVRDFELYGNKSYSAHELMQISFEKIKESSSRRNINGRVFDSFKYFGLQTF